MSNQWRNAWSFLALNFKRQWAFIIWTIIFAGVLLVGMFGTVWDLPVRVEPDLFWHCWELAALGSTILFNLMFYILGFFMPPRMFLRLRVKECIGLFPLLMALTVGLLVWATYISLHNGSCNQQLTLLFLASAVLLLFDFIMAKQSTDERVRQDFMASVVLNDIPVAIAFLVLLIFSRVYHMDKLDFYEPTFRAFVGGAIAFQMLLANWVLALIFRKPGEWYQEKQEEFDRSVAA
jgi:hypothetical protein